MKQNTIPDVVVAALDAIGVDNAAAAVIVNPDASFADLDVDSLGVIEVVAHLESQCGIVIADEDISGFHGPADLVAYALLQSRAA